MTGGLGFGEGIFFVTEMQGMNLASCNAAKIGDTGQLVDTRDNKIYYVAKLRDRNCWMTQNLALDLYDKTLTPADSDVASNWSGASGVASGLWSDTTNNIIKWYKHPDSGDGRTADHANYGNYYSWGAATAGTASSVTNTDAPSSICPAGWQLPTKTQFETLINGLGSSSDNVAWSSSVRGAPYYFQMGGYISSGKLLGAGASGYYWSSTVSVASNVYALFFAASSVNPSYNNDRYNGYSVRCLVIGS